MLIYISGPLTNGGRASEEGELKNVSDACIAGEAIYRLGHIPYIPHLTLVADRLLRAQGIDVSYDEWLKRCLAWVGECDAMLYLRPSPGADAEKAYAEELGKIIYKNLEEIPDMSKADA